MLEQNFQSVYEKFKLQFFAACFHRCANARAR